jgi:glyoxylase-like metal-dependent hydrolase (beta-lactamase superfamily II)
MRLLNPDVYLGVAERLGVRIRYVLDAHVHADHLSRSKQFGDVFGEPNTKRLLLLLPSTI